MLQRLLQEVPSGMAIRYLLVGAWNTLFGYSLYAILTYWLTPLIPAAYMVASVLGTIIAITVSFLGYKFLVFRTKGNILKEYFRSYLVYGTANLVNLALLPILVNLLNLFVRPQDYSPYIAGAILTAGTVVASFFGHKKYTFAHKTVLRSETGAIGKHQP